MGPTFDAQRNELSAYVLQEEQTPFGLTLGNFKTFATSTPKGGIRGLWDADTDQIIFGAHQIAYRAGEGETLFPHQITREFTFLPYAQIAEFAIAPELRVTETFYIPHGPLHDRVVSFVVDVTVHNAASVPAQVQLFPWALLIGQRFYGEPEKQVRASAGERFIRSYGEESGWVRWWGGSRTPESVVVSLREQPLLQGMMHGTLGGKEHLGEITPHLAEFASSRIFGAFEYRIDIAPGARESLRLAVVFHKDGDEKSKPVLEQLLVDADALGATERYYAGKLADARLMTPSAMINRGVTWAKVNMLRVVKDYPQGWGSTNSPPSDILVSRDTSWFVHGYDYFMPQFSRDAIELFNRFLLPSGQVVEYVRGVNGFSTAYDLNVNDDTPLHIIAILHHYNATLDDAWLRSVFPLVTKIADYMLTQRDPNGLLVLQGRGRGHVRHHVMAQHHPALQARRRGDGDQRGGVLRARSDGAARGDRRRSGGVGEVLRRGDGAARSDAREAVQRRHQRVRAELRPRRQLPGQLHRRRGVPGAVRGRRAAGAQGDPQAADGVGLHDARRPAHDLDRRRMVLSLARLRPARRRVARSHACGSRSRSRATARRMKRRTGSR